MTPFAVVILNYKYPQVTESCLESLAGADRSLFRVYLVDNSAEDGAGDRLSKTSSRLGLDYRYCAMPGNLGFAGGVNAGLRAALADGFEHLVLLNNDTFVFPDFAEKVAGAAEQNPAAVLAGLILDAETGEPSFGIGKLGRWTLQARHILSAGHRGSVDFASGCFLAIPRSAIERVGFFREEYFMYSEDVEFCLRLRQAGIPILYRPEIRIRHRVGTTSDRAGIPKDYYRIRNQTRTMVLYGTRLQKGVYAVYMAALTLYQLRRPRMFAAFSRGIADGIRGRLGKRVA